MGELRITVEHGAGPQDITEGVQVCYDLLCASMDWGSGFLSTEEVSAVRRLARACGFEDAAYPGDVCTCGHSRTSHGPRFEAGERVADSVCFELNPGPALRAYGQSNEPVCSCPGFALR